MSSRSIQQAAELLKKSKLVAFPTETVYGLGAIAFDVKAVARVFEAKKRPSFDPLIVHISKIEDLSRICQNVPPLAHQFAKKFWPGPLTLVLEKKPIVPDLVTSGLPTVAVRMPDHPIALNLIAACDAPLVAPSANLFGRTSPTTAQAVRKELGKKVAMILDGGSARVGIESTVIKIQNDKVFLLRPGGITLEQLRSVHPVVFSKRRAKKESPGLLKSHYAPVTPFFVVKNLGQVQRFLQKKSGEKTRLPRVAALCFKTKPKRDLFIAVGHLSQKADLKEAAHRLFGVLRKLDERKPDLIVGESVPTKGLGFAIMDRLVKACSGKIRFTDFKKQYNQIR